MARHYLHLRDHIDETLDPDGRDFIDLAALEKAVLDGARDVIANEIKSGGIMDLRYRIDAEDEDGRIVHTLRFRGRADDHSRSRLTRHLVPRPRVPRSAAQHALPGG